ncbi:MAG: glycosyltransferase family 2 protein, partial [Hungatella sp.]
RDDFSAARNYALDQSDADWNLILDADEYLTEGSGADMQSYLQKQDHLGAIMIRNAYEDDHEISYGTNYTTRLLPRGVRYCGRIHEQADSHLPRIRLPWVFDHDGYLQPHKAERNLPLLLEELRENPQDPYYLYHVASTLRESDGRKALPYYELFYQEVPDGANYRVRGVVGYLYTLMECKEFEKALQLIQQEEENLSKYADFEFFCGIFFLKLLLLDTRRYIEYLPRIEASYLHCLEIGEIPEHGGVLGTGSFKAAYNLGAWYEATGDLKKADNYYQLSKNMRNE